MPHAKLPLTLIFMGLLTHSGCNCQGGVIGTKNAATCDDGKKNGTETAPDCGGSCAACATGLECEAPTDCLSRSCVDRACQEPSCQDGILNGEEADIDCGASCPTKCKIGQDCLKDTECSSEVCQNDRCRLPACSDGLQSTVTNETDVDCGGACGPCLTGEDCAMDIDCLSLNCLSLECQAASCSDGIQNQEESDVDCGGPCPALCENGSSCRNKEDCLSALCQNETCAAPYCDNNIQDIDETDVDCGGPSCPACPIGLLCAVPNDCNEKICGLNNQCTNGPCQCLAASCTDGVLNGNEVGTDCGGTDCAACSTPGDNCTLDSNCDSGVCSATGPIDCNGTAPCCQTPQCNDGVVNATSELCDSADMAGDTCQNYGFTAGRLGCNQTCDGLIFSECTSGCGNARVDNDAELCDGTALGGYECTSFGFFGGTLACANSCDAYDFSACTDGCRNGTREVGEECDPAQTSGVGSDDDFGATPLTCQDFGFIDGRIGDACSDSCTVDISSCNGGCGNNIREGGELCDGTDTGGYTNCPDIDAKYNGGTLGACNATCDGFDTALCTDCGNNIVEIGEVCDGSANGGISTCTQYSSVFNGGMLGACNATCDAFDASGCTTCGNNIREGAELCDGVDLDSKNCVADFGHDGGVLSCSADCSSFNEDRCNDCPVTCASGASCGANTNGSCACPLYLDACNGACISLKTDPDNCGACGNSCASNQVCSAGVCTTNCQSPLVACDRRCIDPLTDNSNCGGCNLSGAGNDCSANGEVCVSGACSTQDRSPTGPAPAECSNGGPAISLGTGGALDCVGDLAAVTFRWALCSCQDLDNNQPVLTDGFDSRNGPYSPTCEDGLVCQTHADCSADLDGDSLFTCAGEIGAGIGANGLYTNNQSTRTWGTLWWSGTATPNFGTVSVRQELHDGGALPGAWVAVDGDGYVAGNVSASGTLGGNLYTSATSNMNVDFSVAGSIDKTATPLTISDPCDCAADQLINVVGIVDNHACDPEGTNGCSGTDCCALSNNDNFSMGLDPNIFLGNNSGGRLDLPCGHYYLRGINTNESISIVVHGRTALYVGGEVDMNRPVSLTLDDSAELDVFIRGSVCGAEFNAGSPNYPTRSRVYIGGPPTSGACWDNSTAVRLTQGVRMAANLYAPFGRLDTSQPVLNYGGLFVGDYNVSQTTDIHFDTAVVAAGDSCPSECGNGVIDAIEACDVGNAGQDILPNLNEQTCQTQGFDGGTLLCNNDCAYDTGDCYVCGDGTLNNDEECELSLPFDTFACGTLTGESWDGGDISGCRADCSYERSNCWRCGNNTIESTENCDGTALGGQSCETLGYTGGTLQCSGACAYDTSGCFLCGDGNIDANESCDPGPPEDLGAASCENLGFLGGGTLSCTLNCNYDTSQCDPGQTVNEVCGNGTIEGSERCDHNDTTDPSDDDTGTEDCISQGFDGGRLSCTPTSPCDTFDTSGCYTCGDGTRDVAQGEACDVNEPRPFAETCTTLVGPGSEGTLECNINCSWDTSICSVCGNGVQEASEACDNAGTSDPSDDILGGNTCESLGYSGGVLSCNTACDGFDTSQCSTCGDGIRAVGESCDPGEIEFSETCSDVVGSSSSGNLSCNRDCTWNIVECSICGNDSIEGSEICDGTALAGHDCTDHGFSCGTLACNNTCTGYDTSTCANTACPVCGNNVIDGSEACDGTELNGETCETQGFAGGGDLGCYAACDGYDTSGCKECLDCRDCDNQACNAGTCGSCETDADCCSPLICYEGECVLY